MKRVATIIILISSAVFGVAQSVDDSFSKDKMRKDLEVFKEIRIKANSGIYKYRSKQQIDSIYHWAEKEIDLSDTYLDFYNIICKLTDFEGSSHNYTNIASKYRKNIRNEAYGYFPYPIKWIDGKWVINYANGEIALGSEIIAINDMPIGDIIKNVYKYYTTDGINITGKRIGIRANFARYYRLQYGLMDDFKVKYREPNSSVQSSKVLSSVSYSDNSKKVNNMYSLPIDKFYYADLKENQKYKFEQKDPSTGILTIRTFSMGNETTDEHNRYRSFLDSVFIEIERKGIHNLVVDVRVNGGGTDPNDLVTYAYLTQRKFQENKTAWISFEKIPLLRYIDFWLPKFLRPLFVGSYNKQFRDDFTLSKNGGFYQDENSQDHLVRRPSENSFTGNIYLLVSPAIASAGSLFAAMVAGNENTITIGEETMGGYYGHNGHTPLAYKLPKSKIETSFFVVNLEQDVPEKSNQFYNRGIIPDYEISQTLEDFLKNEDTQLKFTLELIKNRK